MHQQPNRHARRRLASHLRSLARSTARSLGRTLVAGGGVAAAGAIALPASADFEQRVIFDDDNYQYIVSHMPDLDQRRAWDDGVIGLSGDGSMHCVPTACANLLAYIANHGFSEVAPGSGPWWSQTMYTDATLFIAILGAEMGWTLEDGTNGWNAHVVMTERLEQQHGAFDVDSYWASDTWFPNFRDLAMTGIAGSIVTPGYGFYDTTGWANGKRILDRGGGHAVTMQKAFGGLFGNTLVVRDPADDWMLTTQSTWTGRSFEAVDLSAYIDGTLRPITNLRTDASAWSSRVLDGYTAVSPRAGYAFAPGTSGILYEIFHEQAMQWGHGSYLEVLQDGESSADLILAPGRHEFIVAIGDGDSSILRRVRLGDGSVHDVDHVFDGLERMEFDRQRRLHVLHAGGISIFLPNPEDPDSPVGPLFAELVPLAPLLDFAIADHELATDMVAGLSAEGTSLELWPLVSTDLEPDPQVQALPDDLADAIAGALGSAESLPTPAMAWDARRSAWWITVPGGIESGEDSTAWLVRETGAASLEATKFALPGVVGARSIDVDRSGDLFVTDANGKVHVMVEGEDGLEPDADHAASGLVAEGRFRVTRGRTNFTPGEHDTEAWRHVPPTQEDSAGPAQADCLSDLDGDGATGFGDIVEILAAWGPCDEGAMCESDLDGDGETGFGDLVMLLAAFGECPPPWEG